MEDFSLKGIVDELLLLWEQLREFSEATGADWILWISAAIILTIGLRILRATLYGLFRARKQEAGEVRNVIANVLKSATSLFLFVSSLVATAPFLISLTERESGWLDAVFMVAGVLQVAIWIRVIVRAIMDGVIARQAEDSATFRSARNLIAVFLNIAIFALAAVMIIDNLGGDVTALLAGLGVGGIAIGLAAQNIFKDLFASLSIILDKPFEKGDFIQFGTFLGTVERIGLKTTQIAALSGEQVVIGNDDLLSRILQNYTRMQQRRVVLRFSVTYGTPRDVLAGLPPAIESIVRSVRSARFDRCHVSEYADNAIVLELVYYVLSGDYTEHMDIKEAVSLDIHKLLDDRRVSFAFPTRTVYLEGAGRGEFG